MRKVASLPFSCTSKHISMSNSKPELFSNYGSIWQWNAQKNYHGSNIPNFESLITFVMCRFYTELRSTKKEQDPNIKLEMRP